MAELAQAMISIPYLRISLGFFPWPIPLHLVSSSYATHWLSKVPEELTDTNSPAWNKGKIHYTTAPEEVVNAYAAQFAKDMAAFLEARAQELVVGGMMILIMQAVPTGVPHYRVPNGVMFDFLGSILIDMAKELSNNQAVFLITFDVNLIRQFNSTSSMFTINDEMMNHVSLLGSNI